MGRAPPGTLGAIVCGRAGWHKGASRTPASGALAGTVPWVTDRVGLPGGVGPGRKRAVTRREEAPRGAGLLSSGAVLSGVVDARELRRRRTPLVPGLLQDRRHVGVGHEILPALLIPVED